MITEGKIELSRPLPTEFVGNKETASVNLRLRTKKNWQKNEKPGAAGGIYKSTTALMIVINRHNEVTLFSLLGCM